MWLSCYVSSATTLDTEYESLIMSANLDRRELAALKSGCIISGMEFQSSLPTLLSSLMLRTGKEPLSPFLVATRGTMCILLPQLMA